MRKARVPGVEIWTMLQPERGTVEMETGNARTDVASVDPGTRDVGDSETCPYNERNTF